MHLGSAAAGERFFAKHWPHARAIADPKKRLFRAFGLGRGALGQVMGLATWRAGLSSIRHGLGLPTEDPLMLAGSFAVHGASVIAADVAQHSGSIPDLDRLAKAAAAAGS